MLSAYPAVFYLTKDFTYTVEFPDFEYAAVARRLNFSKLLQRALLHELGVSDGEERRRRRERAKIWRGLGLDQCEEPYQDGQERKRQKG